MENLSIDDGIGFGDWGAFGMAAILLVVVKKNLFFVKE